MKKENDNIELIEKYLEGKISGKDKSGFESKLRSDTGFNTLFNDVRQMIQGVRYAAQNDLLNKLKETERSLPAVKIERRTKIFAPGKVKYAFAVAATVALLVSSIYIVFISRDQVRHEDYFTEYYTPYPNIIHPVQRAEITGMTEEELAYYYYEKEEYDKALELFNMLRTEKGDSENTLFYLANIYMAMGNYDKAIENFTILLNDSVIFENQTRWYLGLCYLEEGKLIEAKQQLERITETENAYKARADELLTRIKN
jgi:tetratricopeptide (TPR) repeat protein